MIAIIIVMIIMIIMIINIQAMSSGVPQVGGTGRGAEREEEKGGGARLARGGVHRSVYRGSVTRPVIFLSWGMQHETW